jgi:hypothetical protein
VGDRKLIHVYWTFRWEGKTWIVDTPTIFRSIPGTQRARLQFSHPGTIYNALARRLIHEDPDKFPYDEEKPHMDMAVELKIVNAHAGGPDWNWIMNHYLNLLERGIDPLSILPEYDGLMSNLGYTAIVEEVKKRRLCLCKDCKFLKWRTYYEPWWPSPEVAEAEDRRSEAEATTRLATINL